MNSYINDIVLNSPLMTVAMTGLIVLVVEASRKTRPGLTSVISIVGLLTAISLETFTISTEGLSFGGMLRYGGYANYFGLIFSISALLTVLISKQYFEQINFQRGEYYILLLFATVGMMLIASANDLIIIFLGIELMSLCLYVLAGLMRTKARSNEAALKYFLLGAFATGFLLYGVALIYGAARTTNLSEIHTTLDAFCIDQALLNWFRTFMYRIPV